MAEVLLYHHVQGLTPGVVAFAETLRDAGHTVHAPDLFNGQTFPDIESGMGYVREIGFGELMARADQAVDGLGTQLVYAGFSMGVGPAQKLAQTRPGAQGALFFHGCLPVSEFDSGWPKSVPVQIHAMDGDPFFVDEGDIDAAKALLEQAEHGDLFLYPGKGHLFADSSLASYDAQAAALMTERVLAFLKEL
jgi:dienelactone hydrolase